MTGPEHYRAAERLLSEASFVHSEDDPQPVTRNGGQIHHDVHHSMIARATAHAILAHAAAAAMPVVHRMMGDAQEVTVWANVIGWDFRGQWVRS